MLARQLPTVYDYKGRTINAANSHYQTLILGSSHGYFGINPDYLSAPAFNGAMVSQDLKYDHFVLEQALRYWSGLQSVVLTFSVFTLYSDLESTIESWRKYSYRHRYGYDRYPALESFDLRTHSILFSNPNKLGLAGRMLHYYLLRDFQPTWNAAGWGTDNAFTPSVRQLEPEGETVAARHQYFPNINAGSVGHFKEIVKLCAEHGLKLLVVTLPGYASYRDHLSATRLATMRSVLDEQLANHGRMRYIDLLADPRFESTDFCDVDHLNHEGAAKISKILDRALQEWRD